MSRARILVVGAIVVSLALVGVYVAAGGASYTPEKSRNPCEPRPWHANSGGLEGLAEEFTLSALDGAACQLGVTRELTAIIAAAARDPSLRDRTWVLISETPDGGWGIDGHAYTNAEIAEGARVELARLNGKA